MTKIWHADGVLKRERYKMIDGIELIRGDCLLEIL